MPIYGRTTKGDNERILEGQMLHLKKNMNSNGETSISTDGRRVPTTYLSGLDFYQTLLKPRTVLVELTDCHDDYILGRSNYL